MLCQQCKEKPATVHLTKFVNGKKTEIHLCQECARQRSDINVFAPFTINDLLSELLDMTAPSTVVHGGEDTKCRTCGMTYSQFKQVGRLGCENCYRDFSRELEPILKRIQGGTKHTGKVPSRMGFNYKLQREIDKLKAELQRAVNTEEFEEAAKLRDEIRELEEELRRKDEGGHSA